MVHSPQQRKEWTQEKSKYTGQITDDTYHGIVGYHNPMWRYMINRHDGDTLCPINILGYTAIPLAIEFSQWGFPVTFVTSTYDGVKRAKEDCEQHSGNFKKFLYFDFTKDCPNAKITLFINIIDTLPEDDIFNFIDMLLRRSREIICSVKNDRDWRKVLSGKYSIDMSEYKDKQFCLLNIKENE